jgi:hypothetical protein
MRRLIILFILITAVTFTTSAQADPNPANQNEITINRNCTPTPAEAQIITLKETEQPVPEELYRRVWLDRKPERKSEDTPLLQRQGGDTIGEAVPVELGVTVTGTTVGYNDDYDEACPYESNAPDVVYALVLGVETGVSLDLCDSDYNTKVYLYNSELDLLGCDDSGCMGGRSFLLLEFLPAGEYFIIVDGSGQDSGNYSLQIGEYPSDLPGESCGNPIQIESLPYCREDCTIDNIDTWGNPSPDEWYRLNISEESIVTITVCYGNMANFDTYLWLLTDDCVTEIAHNDDT